MTSRERLLCAINLGCPDRVPVSPFISPGWLAEAKELAGEIIAKTDPFIEVGCGGGDPLLGEKVKISSLQEGNETITKIQTPKGDLIRRTKQTWATSATVEFPFKTKEDVEKFLSIPYEPAEPDLTLFFHWKERIGEEGLVMVGIGNAVCLPASWFSPQDFCLLWAEEPELIERLTEIAAQRVNRWVEELCKRGVDAFRIVGGEYVTVQLGPKAFQRLIKPYDTSLVQIIHQHKAIAYYHNHGKVSRFLEDLADLGIDALDPLEIPPCGDVDLSEAKRRIGDRVCLVGPLDDMMVLSQCPEEEVKALGRKCIKEAGPNGYILAGTASGLYTQKTAQNFIALAEASKELAGF